MIKDNSEENALLQREVFKKEKRARFIVVTLFGLGPVLLADGTRTERFFTLLVVISLYFLLTLALKWVKKRYS